MDQIITLATCMGKQKNNMWIFNLEQKIDICNYRKNKVKKYIISNI